MTPNSQPPQGPWAPGATPLVPPDPVARPAQPGGAPNDIYRPKRSAGLKVLQVVAMALAALAIVGAGTALGLARYGGAYAAHAFSTRLDLPDAATVKGDPLARIEKIEARLAALGPKGVYVVVDTHNNKLRVYKNGNLLREAVCSTGSGIKLRDPRDGKEWFFDTPQGEFKILRKQKNPIWIKPDWAFIEEGYLPPKYGRDRVDDFSLGDYGLYMRDGYIIHGTIFKTLLGKRVTHGCIRLGDEDLKFVFETVPTDARVYLF